MGERFPPLTRRGSLAAALTLVCRGSPATVLMRPIMLERIEIERLRERVGRLFAALSEAMGEVQGGPPGA